MAQDSNWFKMWPARRLAVAAAIPNGTQRAEFLYLVDYCLELGPLPDDDEEIAFMTAMEPERITALRPYLKRLATFHDGKMMINLAAQTIQERQEFAERMAKNGQKGGLVRAASAKDFPEPSRNGTTPYEQSEPSLAEPSIAESDNQEQAESSPAKQSRARLHNMHYQTQRGLAEPSKAKPSLAQPSHTDMHTCMQTKEKKIPPPKIPYTPPAPLPVLVGGGDTTPDTDVGTVFDALAEIYPGYANNWKILEGLSKLAIDLGATPGQIRAFPAWMKRFHPRSTNNNWNFRALFPESLKPVEMEPYEENKPRFESRAERQERNAGLILDRLGIDRPRRSAASAGRTGNQDRVVDLPSPRSLQSRLLKP